MRHLRIGVVGFWSLVCVWSGAWAWQATIDGTAKRADQANAVAVDGAGDVVAAGGTRNSGTLNDFTVVKWAGDTGAERWRVFIAGTQNRRDDYASAVAVDAAGDVVAAGWTAHADVGIDFTVVKLAGDSGAERWRYLLNGPANRFDEAWAVTVDDAQDVVAAGLTSNSDTEVDLFVIKLAGASGTERWVDL